MSVILDALRKAQDERRRANSKPTDGDQISPPRKMRPLYYLFGLALVLLAVIFSIPDLRRAVTLNFGTGGTPPVAQSPSHSGVSVAQTMLAKSGERKTAEIAKLKTTREHAGSGQTLGVKALPKISGSSDIQVPAPVRQGPVSTASSSASHPKPFSAFDGEQSIVVKTTNVKDRAAELYNDALREMELGKAEDARRSYQAVLSYKPDDAETLNNLGVLLMNGGNTRDAFTCFKMALDHRSAYPKAHNNLGMLYMREGQNRPAEEHLRRALKLDPDGVEPYLNLSALLRSEGRFQEAAALLAGLLQKGCKQPIVHLSYAIINDEMGNYPVAVAQYRDYLNRAKQGAERNGVVERLKALEGHRSASNR